MQLASNRTGITSSFSLIPSGKDGVIATLKIMRGLVRRYKTALPILLKARQIIEPCGHKDWACQAERLHAWVRDRIRFVRDPVDVETLTTPDKLLELGAGDCDDKATLLAALLEAVGHPTRFLAVGFKPDYYEHVLVETRIGPRWVAAETTEPVPLGWTPPNVAASLIVHN